MKKLWKNSTLSSPIMSLLLVIICVLNGCVVTKENIYESYYSKPADNVVLEKDNKKSTFELVLQDTLKDAYKIVYSPDGKLILTGGGMLLNLWTSDGILLRTVSFSDDKELYDYKGSRSLIWSITFSPNSKMVAASVGKKVKLFSVYGQFIRDFIHTSDVKSVAFSPDGNHLASATNDGMVLWGINGKLNNIINYENSRGYNITFNDVVFSPNGKYIAVGTYDHEILLFDINGKLMNTFIGHSEEVNCVDFSPDGKMVVSGSKDNSIRLWDIDGGGIMKTFKVHSESYWGVNTVEFSPDKEFIISSEGFRGKDSVTIWSLDDRPPLTLPVKDSCVSLSPNGKHIAEGPSKEEPFIKIYNTNGKIYKTFGESSSTHNRGFAFSPDGQVIASVGDNGIALWSITGRLLRILKDDSISSNGVAFSPDGKMLVTTGKYSDGKMCFCDGEDIHYDKTVVQFAKKMLSDEQEGHLHFDETVNLWSIDGKRIRTFKGHKEGIEGVNSVTFSPDGKLIASVAGDNTCNLWTIDGKLVKTFKGHSSDDNMMGFGTKALWVGGSVLVDMLSGTADMTRNTMKMIKTDKIMAKLGASVNCVAFSPNGDVLATGANDNTIKLWNMDGKVLKTLKGHSDDVTSVAFSPDGTMIVSGANDKTVRLWSVKKGYRKTRSINILKGHSDAVKSVAISSDSKTIASGSEDSTVKIWSIDGVLINTLVHDIDVNSIAFSHDGQHLASVSKDNTLKIWNLDTGKNITMITIDNEWLVFTSDGYFDSSRNGGKLVPMVKGLTVYSVDQFAVRNNRPDIILERVSPDSKEIINHFCSLYKKRLKKMGTKEDKLRNDLHVPEVLINATDQVAKFLEINFTLKDSKYSLKRYNIYVNDVPIFGAYGNEITGQICKKTEKIELASGKNKIEVTCFNDAGAESFRTLTYADYYGKVKGDLYYIGFGISKYNDSNLDLHYADKDAKDLGLIFEKMQGGFKNVYIKTYLNKDVSIENIKGAKDFLKNAKVDDTFVLFIAGHGAYDIDMEATYYYLTHNVDIKNLQETAANFTLIEELMQGIAPRNKLFLMDTCESGELENSRQEQYYAMADNRGIKARTTRGLTLEINKTSRVARPERSYLYAKDRYIYNDLLRRSGAIIFSSSKGGEFSYESSKIENGFFTEEIIKALTTKETDKDRDGLISIDELRDHVQKEVPIHTNNYQHPSVDRDNIYQKFSFPVVDE